MNFLFLKENHFKHMEACSTKSMTVLEHGKVLQNKNYVNKILCYSVCKLPRDSFKFGPS